jgi:tetratricopeptide (TPR) repeat protein
MKRFITFSTSTRISVLLVLVAFLLLMLPLDAQAKVPLAGQPRLSATPSSEQLPEDLTAKKTEPGPEGIEKRRPETHDQAAANFCHKCGAKLPAGSVFCPSCGTKVITTSDEYPAAEKYPTADKYPAVYELYQKRKFDDVISELEAFCADHPNDVKAHFLLAKAYLEKSHSLKESGKIGWKPLLSKGYNIGKRFLVGERYNPELIYILGKSLYINNRREKAVRCGKKAIKLSGYNLEYSEYFLLVGDAYSSLVGPFDSSVTSTPAYNYDTLAVKYYNYVINGFKGAKADDSSRALAYYRLAVHYSESGRKRKAKESLGRSSIITRKVIIFTDTYPLEQTLRTVYLFFLEN